MKRKKWVSLLLAIAFSAGVLFGCAPPAEPDEPADDPPEDGTYRDGTFEAVSQGDEGGFVHVALEIESDEIVHVEITEYDGVGKEKLYDAYPLPKLQEAHETLAERMAEENTWEVDTFSGATSTSEKAREAARFALERASFDPPGQTYFDGTFMAISDATDRGWGIAWVTLEDDRITDIELVGTKPKEEDGEPVLDDAGQQIFQIKPEDYEWEPYLEAREVIAERMLEAQGPEVDAYTDATLSTNQWQQAVERALEAARI